MISSATQSEIKVLAQFAAHVESLLDAHEEATGTSANEMRVTLRGLVDDRVQDLCGDPSEVLDALAALDRGEAAVAAPALVN